MWVRTWKCAAELCSAGLTQCVHALVLCNNHRYSQGQINMIIRLMAGFVLFFVSSADLQKGTVRHERSECRAGGEASPAACTGRCRVCNTCGVGSACRSSVSVLPHLQPAKRCECFKTRIIDSLPDVCCQFLFILT